MVFVMASAAHLQPGTLMSQDSTHPAQGKPVQRALHRVPFVSTGSVQADAGICSDCRETVNHTPHTHPLLLLGSLIPYLDLSCSLIWWGGEMPGMMWQAWCDRTSITNSDAEDGKDAQV